MISQRKITHLLLNICCLSLCALPFSPTVQARQTPRDNFYWLGQINKATLVINSEQGLLSLTEANKFAKALDKVLRDGDKPNSKRPRLVITFEPYLIEAGGLEITKIHAGRSSQDMLSTVSYLQEKECLLQLADSQYQVSQTLTSLAEKYRDTLVPNYTNGVAAQPNSYGHYLLGYAAGFNRDAEKLHQYYQRLDHSPMGTTVLNGTSWPLDRDKMASYLGFSDIGYNAYDANQIYTLENGADAAAVTTSISLHIGSFIEDVMQQYSQPRPWLLLKEGGNNTYVSSAMPQKRNPGLLNSTRTEASNVIGSGITAIIRSHNIPSGMADPRSGIIELLQSADHELQDFKKILEALSLNPDRALEELNSDWTASQELADVLMREYQIPFRIGHHFASELVTYARQHNFTPLNFPFAQVQAIYKQLITEEKLPSEFPFAETKFHEILNPAHIIHNRATKGGPQPTEMAKMLEMSKKENMAQATWISEHAAVMKNAEAKLNRDFQKLL